MFLEVTELGQKELVFIAHILDIKNWSSFFSNINLLYLMHFYRFCGDMDRFKGLKNDRKIVENNLSKLVKTQLVRQFSQEWSLQGKYFVAEERQAEKLLFLCIFNRLKYEGPWEISRIDLGKKYSESFTKFSSVLP